MSSNKAKSMLSTISTTTQTKTVYNYIDGEFDAAIGLPPKKTEGDYWKGYLGYTLKTGKAPF
jgi:hypothetical protein